MKFFVAIALFAAVASARVLPADLNLTPQELAEVEEILTAIHSPSTDPTTAALLEQMLFDLLGVSSVQHPVHIPAEIDPFEPVHVGPEIIEFPVPDGALNPTPPAPVAPAAPAPPASSTSPLVQIIVNVKDQSGVSGSPVQVDHVTGPTPIVVVDKPEPVKPSPVHIVNEIPGVHPEPVLVGHLPEAVVVSPVIVAPAVVGPEILN